MSSTGLLGVLMPRTRRAVLSELFRHADKPLHQRELERLTKLNIKGIQRELNALAKAGIVLAERSGNRVYYRANPRCPIYPELKMLILKTVGLADVLCKALAPLAPKIKLAYIYGSFATGDTRADSDVDLMIVGDLSLKDLAAPIAEAQRELAREVNPSVYDVADYRERLDRTDSFIARVHRGERIILQGDSDELD